MAKAILAEAAKDRKPTPGVLMMPEAVPVKVPAPDAVPGTNAVPAADPVNANDPAAVPAVESRAVPAKT